MRNRIWSGLLYLCMISASLIFVEGRVLAASFPLIEITPLEIDFGTVSTGSAGQPVVVIVGNKPGATFTLAVLKVEIKGPSASEFSIVDDHVTGSAMDGGMSSTLKVVFKPAKSGRHSADLIISANGGIYLEVVDYHVPLSGNAVGERIPDNISFESNAPILSTVPSMAASAGSLTAAGGATAAISDEVQTSFGTHSLNNQQLTSDSRWWLAMLPLGVAILAAVIWRIKRGKRNVVKPPG